MSLTIRRSHPLVKLAYLFNGGTPSEHYDYEAHCYKIRPTSLCVIFWRCVWSLVAVLGFSTLVLGLVGFLGWKLYHVPWTTWKIVLQALAAGSVIAGSTLGLIHLGVRFKWGRRLAAAADRRGDRVAVSVEKFSESMTWQILKSVKSKMCPMINIARD